MDQRGPRSIVSSLYEEAFYPNASELRSSQTHSQLRMRLNSNIPRPPRQPFGEASWRSGIDNRKAAIRKATFGWQADSRLPEPRGKIASTQDRVKEITAVNRSNCFIRPTGIGSVGQRRRQLVGNGHRSQWRGCPRSQDHGHRDSHRRKTDYRDRRPWVLFISKSASGTLRRRGKRSTGSNLSAAPAL